jgi:hypothetical protein
MPASPTLHFCEIRPVKYWTGEPLCSIKLFTQNHLQHSWGEHENTQLVPREQQFISNLGKRVLRGKSQNSVLDSALSLAFCRNKCPERRLRSQAQLQPNSQNGKGQ